MVCWMFWNGCSAVCCCQAVIVTHLVHSHRHPPTHGRYSPTSPSEHCYIIVIVCSIFRSERLIGSSQADITNAKKTAPVAGCSVDAVSSSSNSLSNGPPSVFWLAIWYGSGCSPQDSDPMERQ